MAQITAPGPSAAAASLPAEPLIRPMRPTARYAFAGVYALAAAVTAISVFVTAAAPGSRSMTLASHYVLTLLWLNLALILTLAAVAGWRVLRLFDARSGEAGMRLHRRFASLFALAAMAPAIIVALFFGLLVTRGVETWFSSRVRTVVDTASTVTRAYVKEQLDFIRNRIHPTADDLNSGAALFTRARLRYSAALAEELVTRDFSAIYVIDSQGRVLARAEQPTAPPFLSPPPDALRAAAVSDISLPFSSDYARGLLKLTAYPDAYVYVVRPMGEGIMAQLRRAQESVLAYQETASNRARIQSIFALSYVSTALLVLVGAVWLGIAAANQIATPVARLVSAAGRVSSGDLDVRVKVDGDPEEIAVLSRAFNTMTSDLQTQQAELRAASLEAQSRRRFIEAVLSGVSAGVIGLDEAGHISAINARALELLGLTEAEAVGRPLADAAPEIAPAAAQARSLGRRVDLEVDVTRGHDTRRLRVRATGRGEGGLVLTFDDITRLVTAQRNAAWRDVARRIAHEIKNPLTPIQLSAERLRRKYRPQVQTDLETFDRCTDTIIRQVGDIGRMVDEFSAFARMPAPKFAEADAAELLREAVFSQRVAYPETEVIYEGPQEPAPFMCDDRMVSQALLNVLKNAGEAISARRADEPGLRGRIVARLTPKGDEIDFDVEDNGVGLPAKDRDRLTEPYVTTREKGTGLGLAIVKRILEEHGGELTLADAGQRPGTRVTLRFPRRKPASLAIESSPDKEAVT